MSLRRPPIRRSTSTRRFVDEVMAELAEGRYGPRAWLRFLDRNWHRSVETGRARPRGRAQVDLLHAALLPLGRPGWVAASWLLTWTHLGLVPAEDRGLGPANLLTLLRANLPVVGRGLGAWVAVPALLSDVCDGRLARGRREETAFGAYSDALADVAFWTWYAWRYEPSPTIRGLAALMWLAPTAAVTAWYFAAGRSLDFPRPQPARYVSAGFQVLLATRGLGRAARVLTQHGARVLTQHGARVLTQHGARP